MMLHILRKVNKMDVVESIKLSVEKLSNDQLIDIRNILNAEYHKRFCGLRE